MRVSLIVNPMASGISPGIVDAIVDALGVRHQLDVVATSSRDHASTIARESAAAGVEVVVVLAGDGTLNEAAQGLVATPTALAPLPGGSTNVFARALGVEFAPLDACAQLLRSLDADTRRTVGVGRAVDGGTARHFLFHLGMGFDAAVVREMEERHAHLKRRLAHPAFAAATVDTWLHHYERDTRIEVHAPRLGGRAPDHACGPYVVVSNCDPYTYVGRRAVTIAPAASIDRALAVTTFSSLAPAVLARAAGSGIVRAHYLATTSAIAQFADVGEVSMACDRPTPWQVDGDYLGTVTHLDVGYVPDALTLVVPESPRGRGRAGR